MFTLGIEVDQRSVRSGAQVKDAVRWAQNARLGYTVFRDRPGAHGQIDALSQAAYAAALTTSLGLVAEVPTTYNEPFHTAVQLQAVDFASQGRAGWLPSRVYGAEQATALGWPQVADQDVAVEQQESVRAARALWDSWEDDAVIRDVATGRFLDRRKVRHIDFVGKRFAVKGPSITPRSPQGQIPVFVFADEQQPEDGASGGGVLADVVVVRQAGSRPSAAGAGSGRSPLVVVEVGFALGSAAAGDALVREISRLSEEADGVLLRPESFGEDIRALGRWVTPKLLESGVLASPRPGQTLRETLGLPRPAAQAPDYWKAAR